MNRSSARALIALAGPTFLPVGFLAKLPLAMGQLGMLLVVADRTGSYTTGGLAAAAIGLGSAAGAPAAGAAADRFGQRIVLLVVAVLYAAGMIGVLLLTQSDASTGMLLAAAALAGLFAPQVGPLARVRWVALVRRVHEPELERQRVTEAFAIEGASDEASFVAGPALVGLLASAAGPNSVPVVIAALSLTAVVAFALHPTATAVRPSHTPHLTAARRGGLPGGATTLLLLLGGSLLGLVFGGTQVGVTSLTAELGHPGAGGLVYGLLGLGSALAGLASARLPQRFALPDRLVAFAAGLAVLSLPMLLVSQMWTVSVFVTLFGCAVAPYLIVLYALAERATPIERAATVMTMLSSAVIVGYAAGTAIAGALADDRGHQAAFAVPVAAGCAAFVLSVLSRPRLRRISPPTSS
ncbi:MFS transporter [Angustibacter sp. McL0619]|uniref:MFS transporter n=1 Tax=Angustibacter sp. McL0619 TaxID=3415676 RepID=UPI003CF50C4B